MAGEGQLGLGEEKVKWETPVEQSMGEEWGGEAVE